MNRILTSLYAVAGGVPLVVFVLPKHIAVIVIAANFLGALFLASYLGLKPPAPPVPPVPETHGP